MIIRKLRLQQGWSQEQLAEMSGLSIRTVQRIERGQKPGLESLKSLAAVLETTVAELQQESDMDMHHDEKIPSTATVTLTKDEESVIQQVKEIKGFYSHLITYVLVMSGLLILNLLTEPSDLWVVWPAFGWGIGIISHACSVFEWVNFFGPDWEKKQIEKRLGRKL